MTAGFPQASGVSDLHGEASTDSIGLFQGHRELSMESIPGWHQGFQNYEPNFAIFMNIKYTPFLYG